METSNLLAEKNMINA